MTDPKQNTVLITGIAGGVGRALYRELKGQRFWVKGLARSGDDTRGLEIPGTDLYRGIIEDPRVVEEALNGVDAVINAAALLPKDLLRVSAGDFHRVNVEGALNVLRQAAKRKVRRCVFFSTISVVDHITRKITPAELKDYLPDPPDAYLASKIELERSLERESRQFPGHIAVLRPAFIYGPGNFAAWQDALRLVRQGKMVLIGDGKAGLPLIAAGDLARFVRRLLQEPPAPSGFDICVVSNPEPTTMEEVFNFIADHWKVRRPSKIPYGLLALAALLAACLPQKLRLGRLKLLTRTRLLQYSKGYNLSGVTTPFPLGCEASADFREGLAAMLDDYLRTEAAKETT